MPFRVCPLKKVTNSDANAATLSQPPVWTAAKPLLVLTIKQSQANFVAVLSIESALSRRPKCSSLGRAVDFLIVGHQNFGHLRA